MTSYEGLQNEEIAFQELKDRLLEMMARPTTFTEPPPDTVRVAFSMGYLSFFQKILPMIYGYHRAVREIISAAQ